ncbi:helicase-related protein, partial [Solilutibacter pythonis]|uniref:helicase-related protein n=1 Tax=Solilutibacter pythonis TaxID=2483112 RepID=UPI001FE51335
MLVFGKPPQSRPTRPPAHRPTESATRAIAEAERHTERVLLFGKPPQSRPARPPAHRPAESATRATTEAERHTERVLLFGKTKHGCNRLAEQLEKAGLPALAIHGNKSQSARQKALDAFKSGRTRILVATDVAARG